MYKNTKWLDKVVDAETGALIQEGTDQSAANFNNIENGISDVQIWISSSSRCSILASPESILKKGILAR